MLITDGSTTAPKQAQAAPVVLFQGAGLASTTAAADSTKSDEEFDYVFENASREVCCLVLSCNSNTASIPPFALYSGTDREYALVTKSHCTASQTHQHL